MASPARGPRAARPGDHLQLTGPGGGYAPDPAADWHLMIGDASVLPAIAASLERVPTGLPVHVLMLVAGADDELPLATPGELHLRWLYDPSSAAEPLLDVLRDLPFPEGEPHAFVHGEADLVRAARRHLLAERGLERTNLSASGYWKRARTEEGWREDKAEWARQVEQDAT